MATADQDIPMALESNDKDAEEKKTPIFHPRADFNMKDGTVVLQVRGFCTATACRRLSDE